MFLKEKETIVPWKMTFKPIQIYEKKLDKDRAGKREAI